MNVAIVTHKVGKGDGQGRVNYEIAREALRRGYRVELVASEVASHLLEEPAASWQPVIVKPWPTELLRNQIFAMRSALWLRRHRGKVGIVHVNGFITWSPGDVNAVHFVHSDWLRSPVHTSRVRRDMYGAYQWLYTALNARLERRAFQLAKRVVAVSERVRSQLVCIGVPEDRIRVILNGVDPDEFQPGCTDRICLGLPEHVPLVLFAGDIRTPLKNLDTLLRAIAEVTGVHLAVVGGTEKSPYPALANKLGISNRVHFLGYRSDVADIMRAADLFALPSRYETFSLVVLEAMASGLPVITASTVGAAELVTKESGIVLHDPNEVQGLTAAINTVIDNPGLRSSMGQAARRIAEQHTWADMADTYLKLYEELA